MSNSPHRSSRARRATAATLIASAGLLASAGAAQAACAPTSVSKIFSSLGDAADYTLAPGGNFESGTSGWTLQKGAAVVSGNSTVKIGVKAGTKSLLVPPAAVAVSPKFCVGIEHPTFRFAARKASGSWATMLVKMRWTEAGGKVNETTLQGFDAGGFATWTVAKPTMLATVLPIWNSSQSVSAQLVFDPIDSGGGWQIDDLYIDPFRRS